MRSEGSSLNSAGLGSSSRLVVVAFATVRGRPALTLGEAFGEGFGWKHDVSDSCEIARKRVEA